MLKFPFKLITFDVNETLLKPNGAIGKTYSEFAKRRGVTISSADTLDKRFRTAYKTMYKQHPNFGSSTGLGWRAWWIQVVKETFRGVTSSGRISSYGNEAISGNDDNTIEAIAEDLIEYFNTGQSWKCEDRAVDLLKSLKSSGVGLGVISNTDPRLHNILKEKQLYDYFNFVLTSYEAKVAKPEVAIFSMAGELYSLSAQTSFNSHQALHVGNSLELDYLPAKLAGWHSVLVNSKTTHLVEQGSQFRSLLELQNYLVDLGYS